MGFLSWLAPGNDHQLAATQYAGRESASDSAARKDRAASDEAARKDRVRRSKAATKADRKGQAWADKQRRQHG